MRPLDFVTWSDGPSMIAEFDVYDRDATLGRLRGNEALLRDVARFFHEDAPQLVANIHEASRRDDLSTLARSAHSLSGMASTFDARQAVEAAMHVERLAQGGLTVELPAAIERLESTVQQLDQALAAER